MKGFELAEVRMVIVDAFDLKAFDRVLSDRLDFKRKKQIADGALEGGRCQGSCRLSHRVRVAHRLLAL